MKVLLITPPYTKERLSKKDVKNVEARLPPLGMLYVAAVLEKNKQQVKVIDGVTLSVAKGYTLKNVEEDIRKFNPEVIGLSIVSLLMDQGQKILDIAKHVNPKCITIIGGPLISADPKKLKEIRNADYAFTGEAELTFSMLVDALEHKKEVKDIPGLVYRNKDEIVANYPEPIDDLDTIPMPARHLINMNMYRPSPGNYRRLPATQIMTSRGCPYRCTFCSRPTVGKKFRAHSAKRVVDEIEFLVKKYGVKDIEIFDDTFTLEPRRVEDICREIIKRKIDVTWNCLTRADRITPELCILMKKAGCYELGFGIESGSQRVLNHIKKDITLDKVRKGIKIAKDAKLDVRGFFIIGHLTETREEVMETIRFANNCGLDIAQYMISTPYPGTELWEQAKQMYGDKFNEKEMFNLTFFSPERVPFVSDKLTQKEVFALYKKAYRSFYLRPKYMVKHLMKIKSFTDVERYWKAARGILIG